MKCDGIGRQYLVSVSAYKAVETYEATFGVSEKAL